MIGFFVVIDVAARSTRFEREPRALWRNSLDGVIVLPPHADEPLFISAPGDVVWLLLAEPATVAGLSQKLADIYCTDAATVQSDLQPVISAMLSAGAIREAQEVPT